MKFSILFLAILSVIALQTAALADEPIANNISSHIDQPTEPPRPPKFSDEQLEKIHSIKMKFEESGAGRGAELYVLHKKLMDAMSRTSIDKGEVTPLEGKIRNLESAEASDRIQMMLELHDVLTPEQREKLRRDFVAMDSHGLPGMLPPGDPHTMVPFMMGPMGHMGCPTMMLGPHPLMGPPMGPGAMMAPGPMMTPGLMMVPSGAGQGPQPTGQPPKLGFLMNISESAQSETAQ